MDLLSLFKGLSDPVRLRIVHLLMARPSLCVCHLTEALTLPQSTISRHLNRLKHAGIVSAQRKEQWVHYRIAANRPDIDTITTLIQRHAADDPIMQQDLANLKESAC